MSMFSTLLLSWYEENKRSMPWRDSADAYKIWVSEIMLQQTRVDQMTPYFLRFIRHFPDVETLASANLHDVLVQWEGLGYYSRARNLHKGAKMVVSEYGGKLPGTLEEIKKIPGIGDYTAAAILSITRNMPYAVVDGNVIRVLTRYAGIRDDVRSPGVKRHVQKLAGGLIDNQRPGDFNQALMELGSLVCKPRNPDCSSCPLQTDCIALRKVMVDEIPYKSPAKKRPHHHIAVGIIRDEDNKVLIARRPENVMLGGLWEFPGGKQESGEALNNTVARELKEELGIDVSVDDFYMNLRHTYSHFAITLHAFFCRISKGTPKAKSSDEIRWVDVDELKSYPFPKANRKLTEKLNENGEFH